jgi:hypothetical protein
MSLLLQDVLVTSIAIAAAVVLVRRVKVIVAPRRKAAGCDACSTCAASAAPRPPLERSLRNS